MAYIPTNWLKNKDNERKVHELLEKLEYDIVTEDSVPVEEVEEELESMGETIILEKLRNGQLAF